MTDAEILRLLRKELGIKQGDFATKISTTQGHISDIENGRKSLSDRTIKLICLQSWNGRIVNEEWLRTGNGEMFNTLEEDEYAAMVARIDIEDPRMKQAIIDYCHLKPKQKELFWNFVDTFIKK